MDPKIAMVLAAGVLIVKTTMVVLDKAGALKKLPPFLRPIVPLIAAALVGLFEALAMGVDPVTAIAGALGALAFSESSHSITKGVRKTRAPE